MNKMKILSSIHIGLPYSQQYTDGTQLYVSFLSQTGGCQKTEQAQDEEQEDGGVNLQVLEFSPTLALNNCVTSERGSLVVFLNFCIASGTNCFTEDSDKLSHAWISAICFLWDCP